MPGVLESGLEPHRAVRLLTYLLGGEEYSQVLITTHSPVLVEHAKLANLATVQNQDGVVAVTSLSDSGDVMQRLRRSSPSALLAKHVVVAEGKTEHGLLLELIDAWDGERSRKGLSTAAGEGVAVLDAKGGAEAALKAEALLKLGLQAAALLDNDDRVVDDVVSAAQTSGVQIIRWELGDNTEAQVCSGLGTERLTKLVKLGVELRHGDDTVLQDLNSTDATNPLSSLKVVEWVEAGMTIESCRERVAKAAHARGWFKTVDGGRALAGFVLANYGSAELAQSTIRLEKVKTFIYPAAVGGGEAQSADEQRDG